MKKFWEQEKKLIVVSIIALLLGFILGDKLPLRPVTMDCYVANMMYPLYYQDLPYYAEGEWKGEVMPGNAGEIAPDDGVRDYGGGVDSIWNGAPDYYRPDMKVVCTFHKQQQQFVIKY